MEMFEQKQPKLDMRLMLPSEERFLIYDVDEKPTQQFPALKGGELIFVRYRTWRGRKLNDVIGPIHLRRGTAFGKVYAVQDPFYEKAYNIQTLLLRNLQEKLVIIPRRSISRIYHCVSYVECMARNRHE